MQKTFGPAIKSNIELTDLARREGILEERERQLAEKQKLIDDKLDGLEKLRKDLVEKLEKSAKMPADEAKRVLLQQVEKDLAGEISKKIKEAEDEIKLTADEKAKDILAEAMIHGVTDYISEFTTSRVKLTDDEMKGRIIGKEGRNVRTFEQATGVDVVMDDEIPDSLILSSFDPIRRELATVSIERLIADGRIQPSRIEELVAKTKEDLEKIMCQAGEKLCADCGVYNLPKDLICLLGRFKYRYSFGQNLIQHTLEETQIGIELAKMIGADVNIVRLGCLLHDSGKIITEGDEGTHVEKGVQLARKFNMPEKVVNCIAEHHEDKPFSAVESMIVYIADAISGARPGARFEDLEEYAKRLKTMEDIAKKYEGVDDAYAFEAGRELRVIISPGKLSDDQTVITAQKIREEVTKALVVPGEVKVTAIREFRTVSSENL